MTSLGTRAVSPRWSMAPLSISASPHCPFVPYSSVPFTCTPARRGQGVGAQVLSSPQQPVQQSVSQHIAGLEEGALGRCTSKPLAAPARGLASDRDGPCLGLAVPWLPSWEPGGGAEQQRSPCLILWREYSVQCSISSS